VTDHADIFSASPFSTHDVANQPPPLEDANLYAIDACLREAVVRDGAGAASEALEDFGAKLGARETLRLAVEANANAPVLRTHDRYGNRIDEIDFHPAWHALMTLAVGHGTHASFCDPAGGGGQVARAAAFLMLGEVENGVQCPTSMTHAALPVIVKHRRSVPELDAWLPKLTSHHYDPRALPIAEKTGALLGMGMTEKQGGSDLRSNTTTAKRVGGTDLYPYRIVGHKWFFSAPTNDAHLVLAKSDGGLSCFFVPRVLPDGSRNAIRLQRLKDKLGNRSNASSEVEFHGALACLIGEEGRGIPTIIEMATNTRHDCVLGTAGMMRRMLIEAVNHARHRTAFRRTLIEQPLMKNLLADLTLESEAATLAAMRLAKIFESSGDERSAHLKRVLTPALKYWVCKRGIVFAGEAIEVLGGNGYVEESNLPRLFREMPLNSIWEGSGNVMCLDVIRALTGNGATAQALIDELGTAQGSHRDLDAAIARLEATIADPAQLDERQGRQLAESIAVTWCASLLARYSPPALGDAYCAGRLGAERSLQPGALPQGAALDAILGRVFA
jgi:putative acyl-CoA dehydrogenase